MDIEEYFDNIIEFPHDRKPRKKSAFELYEKRINEQKRKQKELERKTRKKHNDNVLRLYELGKYNPKNKGKV